MATRPSGRPRLADIVALTRVVFCERSQRIVPSRKKNQMTGAILSMKTRTDAQWPIVQLWFRTAELRGGENTVMRIGLQQEHHHTVYLLPCPDCCS